MNASDVELASEARRAAELSYSPYSNYRVGAVVVAADGTHHTGANVENAAYGSSICAEAVAIARAASSGVRAMRTVAVSCLDARPPGYPCGNCRQLMLEFGVERVVIDGPHGIVAHDLEELIPHGFTADDL